MGLSDRAAAFFDSYLKAFEAFDPEAIAAHFAYPFHMTSDGDEVGLTAVPDEATWRAEIGRLVSFYGDVGVASARMLDASSTELSPRVEHAAIHWQLQDSAGTDLYDFHGVYTLAEVAGETRIVALAHDEIPRALAFATRG
ncbi:MAG TPA: hypothetical protein VEV43_07960 [Actinomycetota bacterium]|nr:hypothetical protein [Actinomycetota bacterium]